MVPKGHGKESGEVRDVTIPFRRLDWLCPRGQSRFTLEQRRSIMSEATSRISEIQPNAAGIDVGADYHWVSIPEGRDSESVRRFSCFTAALHELADWLK